MDRAFKDVCQERTAIQIVSLAIETFGRIDILVNNAGIGKLIPLVESTSDDYYEIMDTNVFSSFIFSKYAAIEMLKKRQGKIIFVSSVTGHVGHEDETIYTMTKFAQRRLSQAIDKELRSQGIKTCVVCPSATKTEFEVGYGRAKESVEAAHWETADDVAQGILYACKAENTVWEIRMR
ncbi:SDR family oxidoreductase [Streptococcus infantarius]|uniref:SDR family oxidoreductase n=1 Tax=Streptococcus infantarius TaxID=102684 RepID=UPI003D0F9FF6